MKPEMRQASPDVSRPSENDQFWAEHPDRMVRLQLKCISSHDALPTDGTDSTASRAGLGSWTLPGIRRTSCSLSQPGILPDQLLQHQGSGPAVSLLLDTASPVERTSQAGAVTQRVSASHWQQRLWFGLSSVDKRSSVAKFITCTQQQPSTELSEHASASG